MIINSFSSTFESMPFRSLPSHRNALRLALRSSLQEALDENYVKFHQGHGSSLALLPWTSNISSRASLLLLEAAVASQQKKRDTEEAYTALLRVSLQRNIESQMAGTQSLSPLLATQSKTPHMPVPVPTKNHTQEQSAIQTLIKLGSSLRRSEAYIDCSTLVAQSQSSKVIKQVRGDPFPVRVHRMLSDLEEQGLADIASFMPHGRSFAVHNVDRFVNEILPKYFKQTMWSSFSRQLGLWGFMRGQAGPDIGGYYHELFLNGRPDLVVYMKRVGAPVGGIDRRKSGAKSPENRVEDPDFYAMKPVR
jgi:hypothetical protein